LGQNSGKAIIEYANEKIASDAVSTFNDKAVDNLICSARPYLTKGAQSDRKDSSLLKRRVYLMNIPYDTHMKELEVLCKEFAKVDKIVIPRDPNGLARGYAFVYL